MIHVFPQETAIQDIAVGQSVPARRVLLRFNRAGKIHFLRMGTESRNPGLPGYVEQLPGQGTSTASITAPAAMRTVVKVHGSMAVSRSARRQRMEFAAKATSAAAVNNAMRKV